MRWNTPFRSSNDAEVSSPNQSSSEHPATPPTRRRVLAAGGALATVGLTGCMSAFDAIAGAILEDVNVVNGTDREHSGSITVDGPGGETRLDEPFTVAPEDSEPDDDGPSETPTYADVFAGSGEYTVGVALDNPIDGTTDAEKRVTVDSPDDQHIIVVLGATESAAIDVVVVNEFSDLADRFNESADGGDSA